MCLHLIRNVHLEICTDNQRVIDLYKTMFAISFNNTKNIELLIYVELKAGERDK